MKSVALSSVLLLLPAAAESGVTAAPPVSEAQPLPAPLPPAVAQDPQTQAETTDASQQPAPALQPEQQSAPAPAPQPEARQAQPETQAAPPADPPQPAPAAEAAPEPAPVAAPTLAAPADTLAGVPLTDRPAVESRSDGQIAAELGRLQAESALRQARLEAQLAEARAATAVAQAELERSNAEVTLAALQREEDFAKHLAVLTAERDAALLAATTEEAKAKAAQMSLAATRTELSTQSASIEAELERLQRERELALVVNGQAEYLDQPLQPDGTLVISDRRIALNGPIVEETAGFVASRVQFFNNQDPTKPIFLVIDNCPGGSVTAGYQILNALDSSEAKIHVVVKGFAASMAAMITTLAEESYMLPNAQILHHQMSWSQQGNISEQRDITQSAMDWWDRIGGRVAEKMGISQEEFIAQMYAHSKKGDWTVFGEEAKRLRWVNHVVPRVHETGQLEHPSRLAGGIAAPQTQATADEHFAGQGTIAAGLGLQAGAGFAPAGLAAAGLTARLTAPPVALAAPTITQAAFEDQPAAHLPEQLDERGRPFVQLPYASPNDRFYLFNPDGYYRMP